MSLEQAVLENLKILSPKKQQQVLDFIKSLQLTTPEDQQRLREQFMAQILPDILRIHRDSDEPPSPVYADSLFRTMQAMTDQLPADPFTAVIRALHDAMAFQNNWVYYRDEQYRSAHQILQDLLHQANLNSETAGQAILTLRQLGFNTMPHAAPVSVNPDADEENWSNMEAEALESFLDSSVVRPLLLGTQAYQSYL